MTAAAGTVPALREIVLAALDVAYWSAKAEDPAAWRLALEAGTS